MKTGSYRGTLTVTKDGVSVGTRNFYPFIHSDSVDKQFPLVQTDKGIYKAGQTGEMGLVQFRILVINDQRKVVQETFTIEIFDADSNRVRRWANVTDSSGVYVELPKFYVELDFPQYVTTASKGSLNGKVSALRLTILANAVEDVTGVNISAESFINVRAYDVAVRLTFQNKFHVGQDVDISGEITRYSGDPYPGIASADIGVWVEVKLYLVYRRWVVIRNSSRIDISEDNTFSYTVEGNDLHSNVSYIYTRVVSNGWYVDEGEWFDISEGQPRDITVTAAEEMRPNFVVMAWSVRAIKQYYTDGINEETDALQVDIKPDEATEVKTRISFDKKEVRPGDAANIHLEGNVDSNFYLLTVDKSILILDSGNDITESIWLYYTGISLRERTVFLCLEDL
ncbi:hypothetical protein MAR_038223 [Mya arenaria]|uniref:Alpha-2-macroglobulin bait region domain-containing protein n=1 Tax=Mya arenaria TaxID=6604 RepID=A0ABY7FTD7_MYAAR|nr:hypothetical protein MAR_038223 [Mya arenaria]